MTESFRVAWYRFRVELPSRWTGLLAIVLLVGLTGGIGLGSIAAARRTQSAYPKFFASTNPSDLTVSAFGASGAPVTSFKGAIARVPGVKSVESVDVTPFFATTPSGTPLPDVTANVFMVGSTDGELFREDRVSVVHGRMADPDKADEAVVTPSTARQLKTHVGATMRLGLFTSPTEPPHLRVDVTIVGIVALNNQVIQDDIDSAFGFVVLTPALVREAATAVPAAIAPTLYGIRLTNGQQDVGRVERDLIKLIPKGAQYEFHSTAPVLEQVDDAIRPESVALGAFGAIALLVTLVMTTQAISRQVRSGDSDRRVLQALGRS